MAEKLEELRKIFFKVKKVRENILDISKLGCRVKDTNWNTGMGTIGGFMGRNILIQRDNEPEKFYIERKTDVEDWKKSGRPLEFMHLNMYCAIKKIPLSRCENGTIFHNDSAYGIKTDNEKELHEQSKKTNDEIIGFINIHNKL